MTYNSKVENKNISYLFGDCFWSNIGQIFFTGFWFLRNDQK